MNEKDKVLLVLMARTLSELNDWFTRHEVITSDEFMELQLKEMEKIKND